jgi:hypothetical protein
MMERLPRRASAPSRPSGQPSQASPARRTAAPRSPASSSGRAPAVRGGGPAGRLPSSLIAVFDTFMRNRHARIMLPQTRVAAAQRKTRRTLSRLQKSGWYTLNNRPIPGSGEEIDHFLVGPGGVFALDSELWDKRLPIRTGGTGRELYHGPYSQTERLEHAQWEAGQATLLVSAALKQRLIVRPAMVLYGPKVPWTVVQMQGVDVFAGDRLSKYLKHEARQRAKASQRLDPDQVAEILEAAAKVLPPR